MLILSILIYLYTPMFIICLYKKPQTHFRVCVPARIRQSAMQSIYDITTIDSCVFLL